MHIAGRKQWPTEPRRGDTLRPRVTKHTIVATESRAGSGSARARLPDGEPLSRPSTELLIKHWHAEKEKLGKDDLDARGRQILLYKVAGLCTTLTRKYCGVLGDIARALGGTLVATPVDATQTQRYFGDLKGFGAIDELINIVTRGVPVKAAPPGARLDRALQYGNHRSGTEHLPAIWKKLGEDAGRQKCLVIQKSAAHVIPNLRVSPLRAVVTHKVRNIYDFSFEPRRGGKEEG